MTRGGLDLSILAAARVCMCALCVCLVCFSSAWHRACALLGTVRVRCLDADLGVTGSIFRLTATLACVLSLKCVAVFFLSRLGKHDGRWARYSLLLLLPSGKKKLRRHSSAPAAAESSSTPVECGLLGTKVSDPTPRTKFHKKHANTHSPLVL